MEPFFTTELGSLYRGDCLEILPGISTGSVNTVFADPPFNIGKNYGDKVDDNRGDNEYLDWCRGWIKECVRTLGFGGAFFLYNIPRWNIPLGMILQEAGLQFRHWIAIKESNGIVRPGRLYPSHYSILYYTKGKPWIFHRIRTPIESCRHCGGDIKDYGGYRWMIHRDGVNLKDVWDDVRSPRHQKFKNKERRENQLSTKLLRRVLSISTDEGSTVLDPFGGSGTTYAVCESMNRRWIGMDIESCESIVERLTSGEVQEHETEDTVVDDPIEGEFE